MTTQQPKKIVGILKRRPFLAQSSNVDILIGKVCLFSRRRHQRERAVQALAIMTKIINDFCKGHLVGFFRGIDFMYGMTRAIKELQAMTRMPSGFFTNSKSIRPRGEENSQIYIIADNQSDMVIS